MERFRVQTPISGTIKVATVLPETFRARFFFSVLFVPPKKSFGGSAKTRKRFAQVRSIRRARENKSRFGRQLGFPKTDFTREIRRSDRDEYAIIYYDGNGLRMNNVGCKKYKRLSDPFCGFDPQGRTIFETGRKHGISG